MKFWQFQLEEFVKNNNERRPCIVYGASGCGKTSILAKAATEVSHFYSSIFKMALFCSDKILRYSNGGLTDLFLSFSAFLGMCPSKELAYSFGLFSF